MCWNCYIRVTLGQILVRILGIEPTVLLDAICALLCLIAEKLYITLSFGYIVLVLYQAIYLITTTLYKNHYYNKTFPLNLSQGSEQGTDTRRFHWAYHLISSLFCWLIGIRFCLYPFTAKLDIGLFSFPYCLRAHKSSGAHREGWFYLWNQVFVVYPGQKLDSDQVIKGGLSLFLRILEVVIKINQTGTFRIS